MRRDATAHAGARIRPLLRRLVPWPVRWVRMTLSAGLLWGLLVIQGQTADGAVLGLLAAGGWGLGLIPVHADRSATGPVRRTVGRAEAPTPPIG